MRRKMTREEQITRWLDQEWIPAKRSNALYQNIKGYNVSVVDRDNKDQWDWQIAERNSGKVVKRNSS